MKRDEKEHENEDSHIFRVQFVANLVFDFSHGFGQQFRPFESRQVLGRGSCEGLHDNDDERPERRHETKQAGLRLYGLYVRGYVRMRKGGESAHLCSSGIRAGGRSADIGANIDLR